MQAGHLEIIGETIAKIRFFENGINSYSRFLDTDRIDFVVRVRSGSKVTFKEMQVKYSRNYPMKRQGREVNHGWINLRESKLRFSESLYYTFVVGYKDALLFPIPSLELKKLLPGMRTSNSRGGKIYQVDLYEFSPNRWGIRKSKSLRSQDYFDPANYIDLTPYMNNYEILKA